MILLKKCRSTADNCIRRADSGSAASTREHRMAKKFIPDGDSDFARMARRFATAIARDPARYHLPEEEVAEMMRAVVAFRDAMAAHCNRRTRSMNIVARKDETRRAAEVLIRDAANRIRANRKISEIDKWTIGMKDRSTRLRPRTCPQTRPMMRLVSAKPGSPMAPGTLVIQFCDRWEKLTRSRPEGATRLEYFAILVAPGAPIPDEPKLSNGLTLGYGGSYTRSPIEVKPPMSDAPMQVVCWGRWAANAGEPGPFSKPLLAGFVGYSTGFSALPAPRSAGAEPERIGQTVIITSARRELPDCVETIDTLRAESSRLLTDRAADAA